MRIRNVQCRNVQCSIYISFTYSSHHVLEHPLVPDAGLGFLGYLGHGLDTDDGVVSLGRLSRQHHAVGSVQDSVGHVAGLSPGGSRLLHHGLQHLGCADDWLAKPVTLRDHLLLGDEDLLGGDLYSHVASGHHAALALLDDLGQVLDPLLVLDLGDDQDLLPLLPENVFDLPDSVSIPDEGSEDHVDPLLHSKQQIRFVLLGDGGKVGVCSWQVAALPGAKISIVLHHADEMIRSNLLADDRDETVVNEESLPGGDDLADVLVVHPEHIGGALLLELVVSCDLDRFTFLQRDFLPPIVLEKYSVKNIFQMYFACER